MNKIGIFYGSDTNNTKKIAKIIHKILSSKKSNIHNISICNKNIFKKYKNILLGIPTWFYGEPQYDWIEFIPILKKINLKKKYISIFGCGDQKDYGEYFCDAIGILYNIIKSLGGKLLGYWSTNGYHFIKSKNLFNKNFFFGLSIDEDRQYKLTKNRIKIWLKQIKWEIKKKIKF